MRLFVIIVIGLAFYMLPTFVAVLRHHHNQSAIAVMNLLLGWTALGWIGALIWACTAVHPARKELLA